MALCLTSKELSPGVYDCSRLRCGGRSLVHFLAGSNFRTTSSTPLEWCFAVSHGVCVWPGIRLQKRQGSHGKVYVDDQEGESSMADLKILNHYYYVIIIKLQLGESERIMTIIASYPHNAWSPILIFPTSLGPS